MRASLAERYGSRDRFLGRIAAAALQCVRDGYMLDQDVATVLRASAGQWDHLMK